MWEDEYKTYVVRMERRPLEVHRRVQEMEISGRGQKRGSKIKSGS